MVYRAEHEEVSKTAQLKFERERLEFAQRIAEHDKSWWRKNSSGLIAAAVSLIAVSVSFSQAWTAWVQADLKKQEVKTSIATFVMNNRAVVSAEGSSGKDITEQKLLRSIMERSYSAEDCAPVFQILTERASSVAARDVWSAETSPSQPQPQPQLNPTPQPQISPANNVGMAQKIYLQYRNIQDNPKLDEITANLKKNGFEVLGRELRQEATDGDVRFFFDNDKTQADKIKTIVEQSLDGKKLKISPLIGLYKNVKPGVFEVWLPSLSQ